MPTRFKIFLFLPLLMASKLDFTLVRVEETLSFKDLYKRELKFRRIRSGSREQLADDRSDWCQDVHRGIMKSEKDATNY